MLHLTADPPTRTSAGERHLSDERRHIRFFLLGTLAMGEIQAFRLELREHTFVVTSQWGHATGSRGESYVLYSNPSLSASAAERFNIPIWRSFSPAEEAEALHIAAECLIAYGYAFKGLSSPDGAYRVRTPAGELSLSSFAGYTS